VDLLCILSLQPLEFRSVKSIGNSDSIENSCVLHPRSIRLTMSLELRIGEIRIDGSCEFSHYFLSYLHLNYNPYS
jgi:hypothetical protein